MDHKPDATDILDGNGRDDPLEEVLALARMIAPAVDIALLTRINNDISAIFRESIPGFRAGLPPYHNLRHTRLVALATARLFHGLWCDGRSFAAATLIQGLLGAWFHDTGLLPSDGDHGGAGVISLRGHEQRSIARVRRYIDSISLPPAYADSCAAIIGCTDLSQGVDHLRSFPEEIRLAGHIVGCADILAQMADRYYLERLPLLFQEQKAERGDSGCRTPLDLMQATAGFYQTTIAHRLQVLFADVLPSLRSHFRQRWQIDEDLYIRAIRNNISYLESIIARCRAEQHCVERHLRRVPPATR